MYLSEYIFNVISSEIIFNFAFDSNRLSLPYDWAFLSETVLRLYSNLGLIIKRVFTERTELFGDAHDFQMQPAQTASPTYPCPNNCGKIYQKKGSLSIHCKYECGKEPQFTCRVCSKKFKRPDSLKTHLGIVHKVVY